MDTINYTPILNSQKVFAAASSSTLTSSCPIDMPTKTSIKLSNLDEYGAVNSFKSTNQRVSLDAGYESLLSTSSNSSGFYLNSFGHHSTNNGLLGSATFANSHHHLQLISSSASSISGGSSTNGHTSDNYSDDSNGAIFSQPSTPVKSLSQSTNIYYGCNLARTPDHKNELVADVSSYYFASIRASANKTLNDTTKQQQQQHFASSNFSHYSASNSNSPIKFNYTCQSPKFLPNPDHYVNHRDGLSSKLLRSPAFKLNNSACKMSPAPNRFNFPPTFDQGPPMIKSFSSRFEAFNNSNNKTEFKKTTTPTQEEFMELLFKNNHLPSNPEFLIGRNMGIDQLDIISELNKRSMQNVIDRIFSNLSFDEFSSMINLVRASSVNREWRELIKQNKQLNRKRIEYLREKKRIYEKYKENRKYKNNTASLSWADKKNLYKNQIRARSSMNEASADATINESESSLIMPMMQIDMNCINQISDMFSLKNASNNNSLLWSTSFSSSMKPGSFDKSSNGMDSQMMIDECQAESKPDKCNSEVERFKISLKSEIGNANNSILSSIGNIGGNQMDINKFRKISIEENDPEIFRTKLPRTLSKEATEILTGTSTSSTAIDLVKSSPKFIAKNLKLSPTKKLKASPLKKQSSTMKNTPESCYQAANSKTTKIDLIGSKNSKRNLKRL